MTREEEIKQAARDIALNWNVGRGNEFYYRLDKLTEMARWADEHPKPLWISVTKQLPNDGEKVNVAIRWVHGEILYDSDVYHEDTGWEGYDNDDVIAWMPIPELKKEGKK